MTTSYEGLVWQHRRKKGTIFFRISTKAFKRFSEPFNPTSVFWQSSSIKYFLSIKDVTGALGRFLWHFSFQQPPQRCPHLWADSLPNRFFQQGREVWATGLAFVCLSFLGHHFGNFSNRSWSPHCFSPLVSTWTVLTATCTCTLDSKFDFKTS